MLPSVVNDRLYLPRAFRGPRSDALCPFSFTSLTTCNSFTLNLFADPHPLTLVASIFYKNGGRGPSTFQSSSRTYCSSKPFPVISFADHDPLTLLDSYRFKNIRGQGAIEASNFNFQPLTSVFSTFQPATLPTFKLASVFRTLFQVRYPATPLFATLTQTAGVCTNNSHSGTRPITSTPFAPSLFSFLALTNCKFRNPFVLLFMRNARGVPPPTRK